MSKELKTKSKQASEIVTTVASESSQLVIGYSILSDFCVTAYSILFVCYLSCKMLQGSSVQHALFQLDPGIVGVQGPKVFFNLTVLRCGVIREQVIRIPFYQVLPPSFRIKEALEYWEQKYQDVASIFKEDRLPDN